MTMELHANAIIDTLIPYMEDIEEMYVKVPRGSFISEDSPYKPYADKYHAAERAVYLVNDVTGISMAALYGTVLKARKWYKRTGWEKCLPEKDAKRLFAVTDKPHPPLSKRATEDMVVSETHQ